MLKASQKQLCLQKVTLCLIAAAVVLTATHVKLAFADDSAPAKAQPAPRGAADRPLAQSHRDPPSDLAPLFHPPAKYENDLGPFRSPLVFDDGSRVESATDWPRRRQEILRTWHKIMGPWPPLIKSPRVETVSTTRRDNITQHQLRLGIAPGGEMVNAFLLVPVGRPPMPAVLVVFYDAQTGIGYGKPHRDFAWILAQRGFVTLSIGKPNASVDLSTRTDIPGHGHPYYSPAGQPVARQPISTLAYIASNALTVLQQRPEVDPQRIGIIGHSFGGKWAMFASCLDDRFACAVWSDPGVVFDERNRRKLGLGGNVNYWDPWYLGAELGRVMPEESHHNFRKVPTAAEQRTGAYKQLLATGHDLVELHALMAPRPFLVSGGSADRDDRWPALNNARAVNKLLGYDNRVALSRRADHPPTPKSNEQVCRFFEWWLMDKPAGE